MPLKPGNSRAVVSENIKREMDAGRKQKQAVAIALSNARKYADGGMVNKVQTPPWYVRNQDRAMSGALRSSVGGRTDHLRVKAKPGSFVLPADTVSHLGQGNTANGTAVLDKMMKTGPYGIHAPKPSARNAIPKPPKPPKMPAYADGGDVPPTDILAAGGEYIIPAEKVAEIGGGDMDKGTAILNEFVKSIRQDAIKHLKSLPGPERE